MTQDQQPQEPLPVQRHEFYRRSETIAKLAAALAKAQGEIKLASKDSTNPHYKSTYAGLDSVVEMIREPLAKHGLSYTCPPVVNDLGAGVGLVLMLADSEEWIEYPPLVIPCGKWDAHGIGSARSYSIRYMLISVFVVASADDDDGNAAAKSVANDRDVALQQLKAAAKKGTELLKAAWEALNAQQRRACAQDMNDLKAIAKEVDNAPAGR